MLPIRTSNASNTPLCFQCAHLLGFNVPLTFCTSPPIEDRVHIYWIRWPTGYKSIVEGINTRKRTISTEWCTAQHSGHLGFYWVLNVVSLGPVSQWTKHTDMYTGHWPPNTAVHRNSLVKRSPYQLPWIPSHHYDNTHTSHCNHGNHLHPAQWIKVPTRDTRGQSSPGFPEGQRGRFIALTLQDVPRGSAGMWGASVLYMRRLAPRR